MGQKIVTAKTTLKSDNKDIVFIYDLKSAVKHFLAGTCLVNDVDNIVHYDDFELIQHKSRIEIKSLTIYREDDKIVGYETLYKDVNNKQFKLRRIASKYAKSKNKKAYKLDLSYNEHIADIHILFTFDAIKYIEITTSKGTTLAAGKDFENGYTSISKVDVTQKSYMPIVAFETTFSNDCLKEIFVYRSPIRFSKKKARRALTVNEINTLKAAPNLESLKKAQKNIELIRNVTKRSMIQFKVLRTFQALAQKAGSPNPSNIFEPQEIIQEEKEDQYMEEQEFGLDDADEQEDHSKYSDLQQKKIHTKLSSSSSLFVNLFKRKDSCTSIQKRQESKENSPEQNLSKMSQPKPKPLKIFALLRFESLKKIIGVNSPATGSSSVKNIGRNSDSPSKKLGHLKSNSEKSSPPLSGSGLKIKKKQTIEEALENLDEEEGENLKMARDSAVARPKLDFEDTFSKLPSQQNSIFKEMNKNCSKLKNLVNDKEDEASLGKLPEGPTRTFSDAIEKYEIANKMSDLLNLKKNNSLAPLSHRESSDPINLNSKRIIGQKRYSEAVYLNHGVGFLSNRLLERENRSVLDFEERSRNKIVPLNPKKGFEINESSSFKNRNTNYLDSALQKIINNVNDRQIENLKDQENNVKLPIRRSSVMVFKS